MNIVRVSSEEDLTELKSALDLNHKNRDEIMADWLIYRYQPQIIKKHIDKKFDTLSSAEQEKLFNTVNNILYEEFYDEHIRYIKEKINSFFETENNMNIDGFVRFRLKEYDFEIQELVKLCGYDYIALREYNEIIDILNSLYEDDPGDD